jgi:hypothetical protein
LPSAARRRHSAYWTSAAASFVRIYTDRRFRQKGL